VVRSALILAACVAIVWVLVGAAPEPARPLVIVFQKQKDPSAIRERADELASAIGAKLGREVRAVVPTEYAASVQALVSGRADAAYVSAIPFLLARRDGGAKAILAEERDGRTRYDAVLVVRDDSPLKSLDDVKARAGDVRICFTSTTSTSGYVMPYGRFVDAGLLKAKQDPKRTFKTVSFGGSYTQALRTVLDGRADVAAVSAYTVEGETADVYLPSAERARLRVIDRAPNVPTHLICVRGGLDEATVKALTGAVLAVAKERPELLKAVYGAGSFVELPDGGDEHVRPVSTALEQAGLGLEGLVK
jgi:phosphonate transport system substrate-binding protein